MPRLVTCVDAVMGKLSVSARSSAIVPFILSLGVVDFTRDFQHSSHVCPGYWYLWRRASVPCAYFSSTRSHDACPGRCSTSASNLPTWQVHERGVDLLFHIQGLSPNVLLYEWASTTPVPTPQAGAYRIRRVYKPTRIYFWIVLVDAVDTCLRPARSINTVRSLVETGELHNPSWPLKRDSLICQTGEQAS